MNPILHRHQYLPDLPCGQANPRPSRGPTKSRSQKFSPLAKPQRSPRDPLTPRSLRLGERKDKRRLFSPVRVVCSSPPKTAKRHGFPSWSFFSTTNHANPRERPHPRHQGEGRGRTDCRNRNRDRDRKWTLRISSANSVSSVVFFVLGERLGNLRFFPAIPFKGCRGKAFAATVA